MGLFGSRDDDPLLQDDPFAPGSTDSPSDDEDTSTNADRTSVQKRNEPDRTDSRTIACTQDEATEGALDELNQALVQEWRLAGIQLQDDGQFIFRLQRDTGASDKAGTVI